MIGFVKRYPLLVVFAAFILVVFAGDMLTGDKLFSELEDRNLKQKPAFSWRSLFENKYTIKYEEYVNDQFVARDGWITLKSIGETALCKVENNGIAYGRDGYMFGVKTLADTKQLARNTDFVRSFTERREEPVTVGIIPNSYELMTERLPMGLEAVQIRQQPDIDEVYSELSQSAQVMDVGKILLDAGAQDDGFYRTDHHWTTDSAYEVYAAFCSERGLAAVTKQQLEPLRRETPGFYGTYFSKSKRIGSPSDTLVWYDIPSVEVTIDGKPTLVDDRGEEVAIEGMLRTDKLETRDKYAMFLYGNNGLTVIKSDNNLNHIPGKTSRLLLIKDSYSNCMTPFLTYSYDELYVVDLRGLTTMMMEQLRTQSFDDIWLLYNYESFESDRNLLRLNYI